MNTWKLTLAILLIANYGLSQTEKQLNIITRTYNEKLIHKTIEEIKEIENQRSIRLDKYLSKNPSTAIKLENNNEISVLFDIQKNSPIYRSNLNTNASEATRTNFIQSGGNLNLNLEGENMTMGIWEVGGKTRITHQEFQTNSQSRIIFSDAGNDITYHSTHVSGTMIASGLVPDAKGMAPKAILKSYTATSDASEAANEANNGLLISNHSYGIPVENVNSEFMGRYNNDARAWDLIHNSSPYYLAVFSAGNDGNETYSGGIRFGYDKLTSEKNSKNNLVVANVENVELDSNGDVVIPAFGSPLIQINSSSSQGPTDDGRIKPDIAGLGTNIFSTASNSDTSYGNSTGTSMSAPNVSGSLLLLQELYYNQNQEYMKSSTAKALVLNTASDAGNNGPDAIYGWGLLNSKDAAEAILDEANNESLITEQNLNTGGTETFEVTCSGNEDLKVMIVWNDPAAIATSGNVPNDPTRKLVNDLDLRIEDNSQTFLPWKLDLNNVAGPANRVDNNVDNVEQIIVENPNDGDVFTVTISHKGSLDGGNQDYSLVITGISATNLNNATFDTNSISVWPNPVANQLNITNTSNFEGDVSVKLYDLSGRLVNSKQNTAGNTIQIDTSVLSSGVYLVNITDGQNTVQKKVIKE